MEPETKEKDPEDISAVSDSDAFCQAYQKFCIALKVEQEMVKKGLGSAGSPKEFRLIDSENNDISLTVNFVKKDSIMQDIYAKIMGLSDNSNEQSTESVSKKNPHKVKELSKHFKIKKDEFDTEGRSWYYPETAPKYANRNGIYVYFAVKGGVPEKPRLRVQYYADNWLFFKKISFSIDGKAYSYIPMDTQTDCGNGGKIWEWCDEALTNNEDVKLIRALSNANKAKMKFIGQKYYDIKTVSSKEIKAIKQAIELYEAMGGEL